MDLGLLNNRITVTADYFKDNKDNLILAAPTATSLGVPGNSINQNIGSMVNRGFELSVSSLNIQNKNFSWSTDLNLTFVKNKITALANNNSDIINTYNINRVGQSIGALYGYDYRGVNPANGNPLYAKADGTLIQGNLANQAYYIYDVNNPTALTTATALSATGDKKILGQGNPTYFGGLNNTIRYKNVDFSAFFTFSGGNKVMNVTRQESLLNQKFLNGGTELLERWTTPGQVTNVPRLYYGRDAFVNTTSAASSRFVEGGSFIRAQTMNLGYTLPKAFLNKFSVTRVRIYAEVQNAFVITHYTGLDPELNTSVTTNSTPGVDYNTNPRARTYTLGLNVGF